jgi:hypothetical protein
MQCFVYEHERALKYPQVWVYPALPPRPSFSGCLAIASHLPFDAVATCVCRAVRSTHLRTASVSPAYGSLRWLVGERSNEWKWEIIPLRRDGNLELCTLFSLFF